MGGIDGNKDGIQGIEGFDRGANEDTYENSRETPVGGVGRWVRDERQKECVLEEHRPENEKSGWTKFQKWFGVGGQNEVRDKPRK